jgi:hypothetical protein
MMLGLAALIGSVPSFLTIHTCKYSFCMGEFASGSARMHALVANPFDLLQPRIYGIHNNVRKDETRILSSP